MVDRSGFLLIEMALAICIFTISVGAMVRLLSDIVGVHQSVQGHVGAIALLCNRAEDVDESIVAGNYGVVKHVKHNIDSMMYVTKDITIDLQQLPVSKRCITWRVACYE